MLTIIKCKECGGRSLPFTLEWEYDDEFCTKCYNRSSKLKRYYFCSDKCLKKFVNKFIGHKHDWEPVEITDETYIMSFDSIKDIVKLEEKCTVCDQTRMREIVGVERNLYKDQIDNLKEIANED